MNNLGFQLWKMILRVAEHDYQILQSGFKVPGGQGVPKYIIFCEFCPLYTKMVFVQSVVFNFIDHKNHINKILQVLKDQVVSGQIFFQQFCQFKWYKNGGWFLLVHKLGLMVQVRNLSRLGFSNFFLLVLICIRFFFGFVSNIIKPMRLLNLTNDSIKC